MGLMVTAPTRRVWHRLRASLAQPEGKWEPFRTAALHRLFYPDPGRSKVAVFNPA